MKNVSKKNLAKYNHFHSNWNNMQIIRAIPTKVHRVSGIFEGFLPLLKNPGYAPDLGDLQF